MDEHIIPVFLDRVNRHGAKEVFRYRDKNQHWRSINWHELKAKVEKVIGALEAFGIKKGDRVGIFSQNKPEWLITDIAIMAMNATAVPFYATSSVDQVDYIVRETGMKVLFAGGEEQLQTALKVAAAEGPLQKIICYHEPVVKKDGVITFDEFLALSPQNTDFDTIEDRLDEYNPGDLATIIYTSGTTGEPKGVMLTHDNFIFCFGIHDERLDVQSSDVSLCFLPLSHVFERMWSHYLLYKGAVNVFLENPREVIDVLPVVKPTLMCAVPRFFDKTIAGIYTEMKKWPEKKQKIFKWSVNQGMKAIEYRSRGEKLPAGLAFRHYVANLLVLKKLRAIFGGKIRSVPCAGAAINTQVLKFFHAVGIFVNYGYGATETTATVSCFRTDEYFYGTCGTVMPGVEVKIGDNSEILVKGRTVFSGYYKKEKETAEVIKNGWFHTGDEGYLDDKNNLIMVDRIKDLMKTSVGKYVSPQKLELLLAEEDFVEQIIVVGDNRQYVSALIVPDMDKLKQIAQENSIAFTNEKELVNDDALRQIVASRFEARQAGLTHYEKVVKFTLLPEPFSIEGGTMTNTLKLRRSYIERMYKDIVEEMYK